MSTVFAQHRLPIRIAAPRDALRPQPGPVRTVGGRVTYAGIDLHENQLLRRQWFGNQSRARPKKESP